MPRDVATCMDYTGLDLFTKQPVQFACGLHDFTLQQALMQCFKPKNWFAVREALLQAGRPDLIGNGCDCLISARPPKETIEARREKANESVQGEGEYVHKIQQLGKSKGYRPQRKTAQRRDCKRK